MTTELQLQPTEMASLNGTLTATDLQRRVNLMQNVMKSVMKEGTHYGIIPGCQKPSLWKPGAVVLALTFSITVESEIIQDLSTPEEKRYRVICCAFSFQGKKLGSAVGECSSEEEKFKWRRPVCDAEYDAAESIRKRIKWTKKGDQIKQVRMDPADQANTILQMADKRAYVAVIRKVTGVSDIFDQDLDPKTPQYKRPQLEKETANTADFKTIKSKFEGKCKSCGEVINAGDEVLWNSKIKGAVYHPACLNPKEAEGLKSKAQPVTEAAIKILEKMATAAGQKLIDRLGADGFESVDQITPEYNQRLLKEFAERIDQINH